MIWRKQNTDCSIVAAAPAGGNFNHEFVRRKHVEIDRYKSLLAQAPQQIKISCRI